MDPKRISLPVVGFGLSCIATAMTLPAFVWLMNDLTLAVIRKWKATTDALIFEPSLAINQPETILGRPVITDPNVATGAGTGTRILFGSFADYVTIRDVAGLRMERSDDFAFANDLVTYRALLRTDSRQVLNDAANSAVKAFRITA